MKRFIRNLRRTFPFNPGYGVSGPAQRRVGGWDGPAMAVIISAKTAGRLEKSKAQSSQTEEYQAGRDQRESLLTIGQASQDRNASSGSVKDAWS